MRLPRRDSRSLTATLARMMSEVPMMVRIIGASMSSTLE